MLVRKKTMTSQNLTTATNGSEIRFQNIDGRFAKVRDAKDNWGNVIGTIVVDDNGDEHRVTTKNAELVIAENNAVAAVPEKTGAAAVMGDAEWFGFGAGEYQITA